MKSEAKLSSLNKVILNLKETYKSEKTFITACKAAYDMLAQVHLDPQTSLKDRLEIAILSAPFEQLLIKHYHYTEQISDKKQRLSSDPTESKDLEVKLGSDKEQESGTGPSDQKLENALITCSESEKLEDALSKLQGFENELKATKNEEERKRREEGFKKEIFNEIIRASKWMLSKDYRVFALLAARITRLQKLVNNEFYKEKAGYQALQNNIGAPMQRYARYKDLLKEILKNGRESFPAELKDCQDFALLEKKTHEFNAAIRIAESLEKPETPEGRRKVLKEGAKKLSAKAVFEIVTVHVFHQLQKQPGKKFPPQLFKQVMDGKGLKFDLTALKEGISKNENLEETQRVTVLNLINQTEEEVRDPFKTGFEDLKAPEPVLPLSLKNAGVEQSKIFIQLFSHPVFSVIPIQDREEMGRVILDAPSYSELTKVLPVLNAFILDPTPETSEAVSNLNFFPSNEVKESENNEKDAKESEEDLVLIEKQDPVKVLRPLHKLALEIDGYYIPAIKQTQAETELYFEINFVEKSFVWHYFLLFALGLCGTGLILYGVAPLLPFTIPLLDYHLTQNQSLELTVGGGVTIIVAIIGACLLYCHQQARRISLLSQYWTFKFNENEEDGVIISLPEKQKTISHLVPVKRKENDKEKIEENEGNKNGNLTDFLRSYVK